jgi:hypothetical protein
MGDGNERQGAGGLNDPNAGAVHILRKTQPWVRLVGMFGFLCAGLMALLGVASLMGISAGRVEQGPVASLLLYPALFVLYVIPSFQLLKYARRIDTFVAQGHTVQLEAALEAQRAFWRFIGVVVTVSAGAMAIVLVAAMIVGIMAGL